MNFSLFLTELWNARLSLLSGLGDTILISAASVVMGSVLGVFIGLAMTYGAKWLRFIVRLYIDFLRGTPVFVLILACFYILSVVGLDLTAFQAGVLALTLFCSSHVGEIVRGALIAIPAGQTEAAKSVGLTFGQTFVYVLLPQALRQILPTWVNTATEIVKASTLLSIIGVVELLLATQQVISRTYLSLEFYLFAGFVYFLLNFVIEQAGRAVERRISIP
ncbi:amino acid ABC transporter permease [Thalassospira indica]|uniref:Amino acid ABC transporter permease n=1 Tax=Thalassospira indica TaxID=1891279 RepID=A0ABM6XXB9_9PROT|nr:amino acid ABC transporter permease [Thalassospira indica]AXO14280.1 amino acid ABC transporter permease [Thalassospira indica]OAZ09223.1 ABC transporter permease [Thalassospira profundimaris]